MKMTFSHWLVENKERRVKKGRNMWNVELAGGVFIKHIMPACVLTESADGAKQQAHKGNGCSHMYLMASQWIWASKENKIIHFIKAWYS